MGKFLYDEQMTAALVGRLMHHCHLILFPGENNRLRESSINYMFASQEGRCPECLIMKFSRNMIGRLLL